MEYAILSNGVKMPKLGFGVFQIPIEQTVQATVDALEVGYRHLDTAQSYMNESQVGEAIEKSSVNRQDIFLTTKVWIANYGYEAAKKSVLASMERLRTDYLDLILLHQPFADYYGAYKALVDLYKEGRVKAIGVSNFYPDRLADLATFAEMAPHVNQVEVNPFNQQHKAQNVMNEYGVQMEAWAPFAEGRNGLFSNNVLTQIGKKYNRSVAQIILRWLTQRNIVAVSKSVKPERMAENLQSIDFKLSDEDMKLIETLDTKTSMFFDHQDPETIKRFAQWVKERNI